MKRIVTLGMGQGGLWLALAGQELPAGARVIPKEQGRFWLRQSVPPMAHPSILHALSEIADALGYPFHGAMPLDEVPRVLDWLEIEIKASRLVAFFASSLEGGGKGPDAPDEPKKDAPKKEKVNPVVEPVSLVLVVKKFAKNPATNAEEAYTDPKRQEITLKTDAAFDGTATFNCDKADAVKFYSAKTGGVEIRLNGTDNVFPPGGSPPWASGATISGGVKIYAEGIKPSAKKDDITVSLSLSGGSKDNGPDDKSTITSVEVTLDICKSRTAAQVTATPRADPDPMSKDDKVFTGRYLHKQDANHHGRALVIVRAVQPTDYAGDVELKVVGAVSLFEKDAPLPGAPAGADPAAKTTHKTADLKKAPAKMWAEATGVSAALRDIEIQAGIKGVEPIADRCKITGVQLTQIKATIKPTPANTQANSTAMGTAAPGNHEMTVNSASEDFTANPPLPLVRNAQPDIELEVTTTPADVPISWDVIRNPADHATIGGAGDRPSLSAHPSGDRKKQILNADNKGSFHVRPFIDCNGSGRYEDREPSIPLNLILFDVTVVADRSLAGMTQLSESINAGFAMFVSGLWPAGAAISNADLAAAAMGWDLDVDVTGGGADGRLGLDMLFSGLANNIDASVFEGAYLDNSMAPPEARAVRMVFASNGGSATSNFSGMPLFLPADPAPALLTMPLLDSGRRPAGVGGESATMSRSAAHTLTAVQPAVGQRWNIRCVDSPALGVPRAHPANASSLIAGMRVDLQFVGHFLFWTNIGKSRAPSGGAVAPADRLYSVVRSQRWNLTGEWTTNASATPPTINRVSYVANNNGTTRSPIARAQDHSVETRPPSAISGNVFVWDGQQVVPGGGGGGGGGGGCSVGEMHAPLSSAALFASLLCAGVFFLRRRRRAARATLD